MTAIVLAAGTAIIGGTVLIALAGLSPFHDVAERAGWCPGLHADDHGVPVAVALTAAALLGTSFVRGRRYLRAMRSHHAAFADVEGITILNTDEPIAVAVPGRPGGIVVGSTLMNILDHDEQSALLAHEQAHLTFNHHRYVHTSGLIAAMFPPLAP
ncbi:MAG: M48 family metalloprotease, partial [Aquihabitans sp.]